MTEKDVLDTIDRVAKRLASIFRFGYHEVKDIEQLARLEAVKGIDKYDGKRPLENFLWTHVRNRLYNYKRDNYERPDKPCFKCPFNAYDPKLQESDSGCKLHERLINCEPYSQWYNRNAPKRNLMCTTDIENINDENESGMKSYDAVSSIDNKKVFDLIDKQLPISMREDYIKIKFGYKVGKKRTYEILVKIREICKDNDIITEEEG